MNKLLISLILLSSAVFGYDITEQHGITNDLYIIDTNQDGKASINTLLNGQDQALVLMHQPELIDIIKGNPYGRESFIFLSGANALAQFDSNQDRLIDLKDMAYANLGLFTYNSATGKITIIPLTDLYTAITIPPLGTNPLLIYDKQNNPYIIKHLAAKAN
jgi:hypothetical protein